MLWWKMWNKECVHYWKIALKYGMLFSTHMCKYEMTTAKEGITIKKSRNITGKCISNNVMQIWKKITFCEECKTTWNMQWKYVRNGIDSIRVESSWVELSQRKRCRNIEQCIRMGHTTDIHPRMAREWIATTDWMEMHMHNKWRKIKT